MNLRWHLIIHGDEDVRDLAGDAIRAAATAAKVKSNPIKVGNLDEARRTIDDWDIDGCDLVVIEAAAAADRRSRRGNRGLEGMLAFVKEVKKLRPCLPVIVLTPTADGSLTLVLTAFEATEHAELLTEWRDWLEQRATELLSHTASAGKAHLVLDITLASDDQRTWRIRRTGDSSFQDFGDLYVEERKLAKLINRSNAIERSVEREGWESDLRDFSDDLITMLFEEAPLNRKLWRKFVDHRARVGGVENTRVRVTLNEETHPILVEALRDDDDQTYWMLKAPIFRTYRRRMEGTPLFKDRKSRDGPINCLVIQADPAAGNVPEGPWCQALAALPAIEEESLHCVRKFESMRGAGIGEVHRLSIADIDDDPIDALNAKLAERDWHLVHFAGHSVVSSAGEAGLVLAAERDGVVRVADLANKLSGTQFLFLNSCRSAAPYVVMRAVENQVPSLLGFRWAVPDASGARFAASFYDNLFDRSQPSYKYIEYAFMRARSAVHARDASDPTWASPVLVMQSQE